MRRATRPPRAAGATAPAATDGAIREAARASPRASSPASPQPSSRDTDSGSDWLRPIDGGWTISVWVQPGARSTEPAGVLDGCLKLRLSAPPVDGRANEELLRWVAGRLDLPLRAVELAAGASSRRKRLRADCALGRDEVAKRLLRP